MVLVDNLKYRGGGQLQAKYLRSRAHKFGLNSLYFILCLRGTSGIDDVKRSLSCYLLY